ncbi:MAG: ShlB/FhaC/HecB family hemolysin secretion/activation protein [Verrucomicrobiota bacterium]
MNPVCTQFDGIEGRATCLCTIMPQFMAKWWRFGRLCSVGLLICVFLCRPISGQIRNPADDLLPKFDSIRPYQFEREEQEEPEIAPPPKEKRAPEGDEELIESLKGLYLTSNPDDILKEGREDVRGVVIEGLPLLDTDDFRELTAPFIDQPVTLNRLKALVRGIVQYYRDLGMPVVDPNIGEQDITVGVVQILILEGRLGEVRAEENIWFTDRQITSKIRMKRAELILSKPLIEDMSYLNRNPFRRVNVVFEPGEERGQTDLILKTQDRLPVRIYAGYEDTGNDLTGEERWLFGFNWGNALWLEHSLSYQYTASADFETLTSHSITYEVPVTREQTWNSFFTISNAQDAELDRAVVGDGLLRVLNGDTIQTGTSYRFDLPSPNKKNFKHAITPGFVFKKIGNVLDVEEPFQNLNRQLIEVFNWTLTYDALLQDPYGFTRFDVTATHSFGNWTSLNGSDEFNSLLPGGGTNGNAFRAGADPTYSYLSLFLERVVIIPWDFELHGRLTWQFSDSNLIANEQLAFGGYNTVRGYTEAEVRGDEGYFFNLEFRTPAFSVSEWFGATDPKDRIQLLGFWDYGRATSRSALVGENLGVELSSAGAGIRVNYDKYFSLRADYGFQLVDTGFNNRFNSRLHLGVIFSYW